MKLAACSRGMQLSRLAIEYCAQNNEVMQPPTGKNSNVFVCVFERSPHRKLNFIAVHSPLVAYENCTSFTCQYAGYCFDSYGDGRTLCVCDFECGVEYTQIVAAARRNLSTVRSNDTPVCGTDGRIYVNECQMNEASCRTQMPIYREPSLLFCERGRQYTIVK